MAFKLEAGGIEAPPQPFRSQGLGPGATLHEFATQKEVTDYCNAHGQAAYDPYNHGAYNQACYDFGNHVVAIIDHSKVGPGFWKELFDHEAAHSWGLRHEGNSGRGWQPIAGSPAESVMGQPPEGRQAALARILGGMNGR